MTPRSLSRGLIPVICFGLVFPSVAQEPSDSPDNYQALLETIITGRGDLEGKLSLTVDALKAATSLDDTHARIQVRRDLAALAESQGLLQNAFSHREYGIKLARELEDADLLLALYLSQLKHYVRQNDTSRGVPVADATIEIAIALGKPKERITAELDKLHLLRIVLSPTELTSAYHKLLNLPGADPFTIKLRQARDIVELVNNVQQREDLWLEVSELASASGHPVAAREAWEYLASLSFLQNDYVGAAERYKRADAIDAPQRRTAGEWRNYVTVFSHQNDVAYALAFIQDALATTQNTDPGYLAELYDGYSHLEHEAGEIASAYQYLRRATELREEATAQVQFFAPAPLLIATAEDHLDEAADTAAIRNAQREAELALTRAHRQNLILAVLSTLVIILLLVMANRVKRQSAIAAKLRADNARLETLRYQLNPHFLHNTLTNLSGLILSQPETARETVGRLSDFCRMVLDRGDSPLLSVTEESERLRAYLDIVQAAEEEDLNIEFEVDDRAKDLRIPPLLIQPLIENALKFADAPEGEHRQVTVGLSLIAPESLQLTVSNSGRWQETIDPELPSHGIGLTNLQERLERFYPNNHTLEFDRAENHVTITLVLRGAPTHQS